MATIRDVARRAGVSIATVSRVINGQKAIRPETRARVQAAIDSLGFRLNAVGRTLKAGKSHTLGVLVPTLSNPVFAEAVEGLQHRARASGYGVMVTTSDYDAGLEREAVETLLVGRVDALVLTVTDPDAAEVRAWLLALERPAVLLYNQPGPRPTVTIDNEAAGRAAGRVFLQAGHRCLAMIAGSFAGSDRGRARWRGFAAAVAEHQPHGWGPTKVEIPFAETDLRPALSALLSVADPPTGLFCSNDLIALRAIAALRGLGYRVPGDVSVLGFDGIAAGALIEPSLSSIAQPSRTMGETAAALVLSELAGGVVEPVTLLPHRLIEGASVAPPAGASSGASSPGAPVPPTETGVAPP